MQATIRRSYVACTVTLTTANTNYNLWELIKAVIEAQVTGDGVMVAGAVRELNIQAASGNASSVLVGDNAVSATNCGYELVAGSSAPGASRTYRASNGAVSVADLYVRSAGSSQKLNVELCSL